MGGIIGYNTVVYMIWLCLFLSVASMSYLLATRVLHYFGFENSIKLNKVIVIVLAITLVIQIIYYIPVKVTVASDQVSEIYIHTRGEGYGITDSAKVEQLVEIISDLRFRRSLNTDDQLFLAQDFLEVGLVGEDLQIHLMLQYYNNQMIASIRDSGEGYMVVPVGGEMQFEHLYLWLVENEGEQ